MRIANATVIELMMARLVPRFATMLRAALALTVSASSLSAQPVTQNQPFNDRWHSVPDTAQSAKKQVPTPKQAEKLPIDLSQALYLIRSTLLTLNDANRSGNYSVLRDLSAPTFQARNSAADLASSFADLRNRHFDLFAAALLAPTLTAAPQLDTNGMLRLTGFFPTRPLEIKFDMLFQSIDGKWALFGLAVGTPPASPPAVPPTAQSKPPAPQ